MSSFPITSKSCLISIQSHFCFSPARGVDWNIMKVYVRRRCGKAATPPLASATLLFRWTLWCKCCKGTTAAQAEAGMLAYAHDWLIDWYTVINQRAGCLFNHSQSLWTLITATILPVAVSAHYKHRHLAVCSGERETEFFTNVNLCTPIWHFPLLIGFVFCLPLLPIHYQGWLALFPSPVGHWRTASSTNPD